MSSTHYELILIWIVLLIMALIMMFEAIFYPRSRADRWLLASTKGVGGAICVITCITLGVFITSFSSSRIDDLQSQIAYLQNNVSRLNMAQQQAQVTTQSVHYIHCSKG